MKRRSTYYQLIGLLAAFSISNEFLSAQSGFNAKYDAAASSDRCYTVTSDKQNQMGAIWWDEKQDFSQNFTQDFVVYMGDKDPNGASGLAFVIHADPRDTTDDASVYIGNRKNDMGALEAAYQEGAFGEPASGLGYATHPAFPTWNIRISPSVAIEFDTFNDRDVPDGNNGKDGNGANWKKSTYFGWDHTSVVYNGDLFSGQQLIEDANGIQDRILPLKPEYIYGSSNNPDGSSFHNIEDDQCYIFRINWIVNGDGTQTLELWSNYYTGSHDTGDLGLVMRHTDGMLDNVFGGQQLLRWGFTGTTEEALNAQSVCLLEDNSQPAAQDDYLEAYYATGTILDILANDMDPNGDRLFIPSIAIPPHSASASIFDSLGTSYLRYIPDFGFSGIDSLAYVTCDANSTQCYSKCDTAWVYIDVRCLPFSATAEMLAPNVMCTDTARANGAADAGVIDAPYPGTLWFEGFSDLDNATEDNGETPWSFTTSGNCAPGNIIQVQKGRFRSKKTVCEVVWKSGVIDISGLSDISITFDLWSSGNADINDYIKAYYVVDGSGEIPFDNGEFQGHFQIAKAATSNINGEELQIVIRIKTAGQGSGDDNYFIDNIHVRAVGANTAIRYLWYEGPAVTDSVLQEGEILTNVHHGLYTVVAVDEASGCPSEPFTVEIDSTGKGLPGAFVDQTAPFTTCDLPYDGMLTAGVTSGSDTISTGYLFEWYYSENLFVGAPIRVGPLAENLEGRDYTVHITDLTTGCDTIVASNVPVDKQIPAITANVLRDVTSCIIPNSGAAEASVTGSSEDIVYEWFSGVYTVGSVPDHTGQRADSLVAGTYAVVAVDTGTSCISAPETVVVNEQLSYPAPLITNISHQISCDTLSPTGSVAGAVLQGTDTLTASHSFYWYRGQNDVMPARPGYSGGPIADSLPDGTYRLVATNDTTGCSAFIDAAVQDQTTIPTITAIDISHINQCRLPLNSGIVIHPDGDTADFTYQVYRGAAILNDSLWTDSAVPGIHGLPVGTYSVTITDPATGCRSLPSTVAVLDQTQLPAATFTTMPQTSCDPGNLAGRVVATPDAGSPGDYLYRWHISDTTDSVITNTMGTYGEQAAGLDSGRIALYIEHSATGCANVLYSAVAYDPAIPAIDSVRATPTTGCNAAVNGQLSATVNGGSTDAALYIFEWENVGAGSVLADTTATATGLDRGDYQLTVTDRTSRCSITAPPVTITRQVILPDPVISVVHNTSCDPASPGGIISVSGMSNGSADLNDYTYSWHYDSLGGPPLTTPPAQFTGTPDSAQVSGLGAGLFVLHIVDRATECSNAIYVPLSTLSYIPSIDSMDIQHTVQCTGPFYSGAEITGVSGGAAHPADYTYEWTYVDGGNVLLADSSYHIYDSLTTAYSLPAGQYRVRAFNEYNCASDYLDFVIRDNSVIPPLLLRSWDNTSCNPAAEPNGIIHAEIDTSSAAPSDYTFEWLDVTSGSPVDPAKISTITTGQAGSSLPTGDYRINITDNTTQCTQSALASVIQNTHILPVIDTVFTRNITSCLSPDGAVGWRVDSVYTLPPQLTQNRAYTYYMEPGTGITDTTTAADRHSDPLATRADTVAYGNLNSGTWTAIVVDNHTGCVSLPMTVQLEEAPMITVTNVSKMQPTSCLHPDGVLEILAATPTNNEGLGSAGFSFSWLYHGNDPNNAGVALLPANDGTETGFRSGKVNLDAGFYSISLTDLQSGCVYLEKTNLDPRGLPPILVANSSDADQCAPANGSVTFQLDSIAGVQPPGDYIVYLYEGSLIDPLAVIDSIVPGAGTYPYVNVFSGLPQSDYAIAIRENFGAGDCYSQPLPLSIGYVGPALAALPGIISNDLACTGAATGTGQLREMALPATGYAYIWYVGRDTSATTGSTVHGMPDQSTPASWIADNSTTTADLDGGLYTLVVKDTQGPGLGCVASTEIILPKEQLTIVINDAPVTDKNACSVDNGGVYIHTITENGSMPAMVDTTNYTYFELMDSNFMVLQSTPAGPAPYLGTAATPFANLDAGPYFVRTRNMVTNCRSAPKAVQIKDVSVYPSVRILVESNDFNCTGPAPTGHLVALANGDTLSANFSAGWYVGTDTTSAPITGHFSASGLSANMGSQLYTVVVEDINGLDGNLGCKTVRSQTLLHQPPDVHVFRQDIDVDPITTCASIPDGHITVQALYEIFANQDTAFQSPAYTGLYDLQLLDTYFKPIDPVTDPYATFDAANGMFSNLPGGIYYVRAQNVQTGCGYGPPRQVVIEDVARDPLVHLRLSQADFSCSGGTATGILEVSALTGGSDGDNDPAHFLYTWINNQTGDTTQTDGGTPPRATQLMSGSYTLYTTDRSGVDSLCMATAGAYVPVQTRPLVAHNTVSTPQYVCFDNGTIHVAEITQDTTSVVLPDARYDIILYDQAGSNISGVATGSGTPADPFAQLPPGTYYVQIKDTLTQCTSAPEYIAIADSSTAPVIASSVLTPQYSLNPDPASWTGILSANALEQHGATYPQGYSFAWHAGIGTGGMAVSTDTVMVGLDEGYYTIRVTSDSTMCTSTRSVYLPFVYLRPQFDPLTVPQSLCNPENGSIRIDEIFLEGTPDDLLDYTFYVSKDTYQPGNWDFSTMGTNPNILFDSLGPGSYYIQARENLWWVESYPVHVQIEDESVQPLVYLDPFAYQPLTSCDPTVHANGVLAVVASEEDGSAATYTYTWFDASGNPLPGSNSNTVSGLDAGEYSVQVLNVYSGCSTNTDLFVSDQRKIPLAAIASNPATNCDLMLPNGVLSGSVINTLQGTNQQNNYIFNWFEGDSVHATPDHTGQIWKPKNPGIYTLQVTDRTLPTCISLPVTENLYDDLRYPEITIQELRPLTNCDPEKANAMVTARADGVQNGYRFEWYMKDGPLVFTGPTPSQLGDTTYLLVATDLYTGCSSEKQVKPSETYDIVPVPEVLVISPRASCLQPDGVARATMPGGSEAYDFAYFDRTGQLFAQTNGPVYGLDTAMYQAVATSRATGCSSGPKPFVLGAAFYYPQFDIFTTPSLCTEATGAAELVVHRKDLYYRPYWTGPYGGLGSDDYIHYLDIGQYLVEVEGSEGCFAQQQFEIGGDIIIYNGVSDNSDGLNDFFQIVCLEIFPNNNVKIFNRTGVLVFEMAQYDMYNPIKRFNGKGNRGIYFGGKELPVGTYYFVVDKGEGSKASVGYLELKR